ncbi:hypothetical protein ABTL61_19230, partial [Acinetobacter baumannii]
MFYLHHLGILCGLGQNHADIKRRLYQSETGIAHTERYSPGLSLPLACVTDTELVSVEHLPLQDQSRNNQLALTALAQIR